MPIEWYISHKIIVHVIINNNFNKVSANKNVLMLFRVQGCCFSCLIAKNRINENN